MSLWTRPDFFATEHGDATITVNLTPNGFADAVTTVPAEIPVIGDVMDLPTAPQLFVKPQEVSMSLREFMTKIQSNEPGQRALPS